MAIKEVAVDERELRDMVDEVQIRRLHAKYVDAVNRSAWSEFTDLFVPDARLMVSRGSGSPDEVVGPAAIGALIAGYIDKYDFLLQVVLNARITPRVDDDVDRAAARLYIAEFRQYSETGRVIESAGTYHDQYVRRDGSWRFERRRYDRMFATSPAELEVHAFPSDLGDLDPFVNGR